jgi:hypothetical protein
LNYARLKDVYGNARIDAILHESLFGDEKKTADNPDGRETFRLAYRSNAQRLFRVDTEPLDWKSELPTGTKSIAVAGPQLSFFARQTPDLRAPFSYRMIPLELIVFNPQSKLSKIESVKETSAEGVRLVSLRIVIPSVPDKPIYEYTFLRDSTWALRDYHGGPDTGGAVDYATLNYEGVENGVPVIKRAVYWAEQGPEKKRFSVRDYEITRFIPSPVAEKEFLPSALDLSIGKPEINWWPRILVLVFAFALLTVYFSLKRRAQAS